MAAIILYGIASCDSCKKAVTWLKANGHGYRFHDLRADGPPDASQIRGWCGVVGWENILNRRSTTYRALSPDEKVIENIEDAVGLIVRYPLLLKRPLIESASGFVAGFDPDQLTGILPHA